MWGSNTDKTDLESENERVFLYLQSRKQVSPSVGQQLHSGETLKIET